MEESKKEHLISREFGATISEGMFSDDKENNNKNILVEYLDYCNQGAKNPENLIKLIKQKLKAPFSKKK